MTSTKKLIIIDGYGFLFRAFYSMPPLTTPGGQPIGAIYGFCSMLLRIMNDMAYTHIAVALDSGAKTFRNEMFADYKANRAAPPDDLIPQFPEIRRAVESFNIKAIELVGYEADDIIATLATEAMHAGYEVGIISTDKDLMQLINDNTQMFDGLKNKNIGQTEVIEKFGVPPSQVRDVLSLIGDSSDNIPGVKGIGPKGAAELIKQFGSLANLLSSLDQVHKPKLKASLIENKHLAELSYQLITLKDNLELGVSLPDLMAKSPVREVVTGFFEELGFKTLLSRVKFESDPDLKVPATEANNSVDLKNLKEFEHLVTKIHKAGKFAILYSVEKPEFISFAVDDMLSYNLALSNEQGLLGQDQQITFSDIQTQLITLIEDESLIKIGYDIKAFCHFIYANSLSSDKKIASYEDIMLMSYVLDNGRLSHDLRSLIKHHLMIERDSYAAGILLRLYHVLKPRLLSEEVLTLYTTIENPLSIVLYRLETVGIKTSINGLKELGKYFEQKISDLEVQIFKIAGFELNLGSPKQLSELLFDKMGYKSQEKTSKTKSSSTSAEVLEELAAQGVEIASLILKWRQFSKLNSTYTNSLIKFAGKDQRIHTNFRMCVTSTGRLSSIEPNLQNIPTRTEEGVKIRSNFIADEGKILISADYSQIELRLLANMANVKSLIAAFNHNLDIHRKTASEIFKIPLEEVNDDYRRKAKAINFGIIYGISAFGLANNLGIARGEAKHFIDLYFNEYPEIKDYMTSTIEFARKNGFVFTIFGRRCYLPGINDKNFNIRSFSERAAINAPIQGSQADVIKKAMIKIDQQIQQKALKSRMVLQIHDELIIEAPLEEQEEVTLLVKNEMEAVTKLQVPTPVDISFGQNWGEL